MFKKILNLQRYLVFKISTIKQESLQSVLTLGK